MKKITKILIAIILISAPFASKAMPSDVFTYPIIQTEVTDTTATLRGKAIPCAPNTTCNNPKGYFRYSTLTTQPVFCNDIYGSDMIGTSDINLGLGSSSINFSKVITNLDPNTKYYYCAYASDRSGIVPSPGSTPSPVQSFKTKAPTQATTKNATNVTKNSATINGEYNTETTAQTSFEYGISSSQVLSGDGAEIQPITQTTTNIPFKANLVGLTPNTSYFFRAVAHSPNRPNVYGQILSFNTKSDETTTACPTGTSLTIPPTSDIPCPIDSGTGTVSEVYTPGVFSPTWPLDPATLPPGTPIKVTTPTGPGTVSIDTVVRNREGVEHVFQRQIEGRPSLAKIYGYQSGTDLKIFSWNLAHTFAQLFGYINNMGKEIRVSYPNIAAYELKPQIDGSTIVNEYLIGTLIETRKIKPILKTPPHSYEYYFQAR